MFFGSMDMSAPSKKPQATMSPKGGTPAKDKIFTLCIKGHMSFRPKPPFLLSHLCLRYRQVQARKHGGEVEKSIEKTDFSTRLG